MHKFCLKRMRLESRVRGCHDVFVVFAAPSSHRRLTRGGHALPKVSPGLPCPTLLCPAGRFRGSSPTARAACGSLLPLRTTHAVRLCIQPPPAPQRLLDLVSSRKNSLKRVMTSRHCHARKNVLHVPELTVACDVGCNCHCLTSIVR
jgi:hypothetical protein